MQQEGASASTQFTNGQRLGAWVWPPEYAGVGRGRHARRGAGASSAARSSASFRARSQRYTVASPSAGSMQHVPCIWRGGAGPAACFFRGRHASRRGKSVDMRRVQSLRAADVGAQLHHAVASTKQSRRCPVACHSMSCQLDFEAMRACSLDDAAFGDVWAHAFRLPERARRAACGML